MMATRSPCWTLTAVSTRSELMALMRQNLVNPSVVRPKEA